jgi:hypothetical protein
MNQNLIGSIYGRSSTKVAHFVPIRYQTWPPLTNFFLIGRFLKKSSPMKLLDQMNRNLVGRILDRSSVEITHFDAIVIKHGRPQTFFF